MSAFSVSAMWARIGIGLMAGGLVAALLIWGLRDLDLIAQRKIDGNSVSKTIQVMLYGTHPGVLVAVTAILMLAIGVLIGHFGWAQTRQP